VRWLCILGFVVVAAVAGCGSTSTVTKTVTHTVTTPSPAVRASVAVPFVQGLTEALATRKVKGEGLVVRSLHRQHAGVPSGLVYDHSPAAGSHARQGATITISVFARAASLDLVAEAASQRALL
jgi:beta-lactam-binding protein with PASTA domain